VARSPVRQLARNIERGLFEFKPLAADNKQFFESSDEAEDDFQEVDDDGNVVS
jgi:hypothetical protein